MPSDESVYLLTSQPDLVSVIKGQKIRNIVRVNSSSIELLRDTFGLEKKDFFSGGRGPFLITFDNQVVIAINRSQALRSMCAWIECDGAGNGNKFYVENRRSGEQYVQFDDPIYSDGSWNSFVGKTLLTVSVVKSTIPDPIHIAMPQHFGIVLGFEENLELLFFLRELDKRCGNGYPGLMNKKNIDLHNVEYLSL